MGVVYRATQLDLDRTVALKMIAADLAEDETARRRFLRESRAAAAIDHPHVIPIHAAGEADGVPFLVMRYVDGQDARTLVRREGPLAPGRAARIVDQVASALDAAHAAGLVHRDVKPSNVLLASGDHAYLCDFGLTRHMRSVSGPTRAGDWVGTLDYVAPEQIRGGHVDARADVYALGCLLFFLLSAQVPFPRDGDEARLWAHLTERPPRISAVAPSVPSAFDAVIERALAKAPDSRYPSAGDLGRAAIAAAEGRRARSSERTVASGAAAPIESPTDPSGSRPRTRPAWRLAAPLVLAVAAVAGVAAVLTLGDGQEPPPATAAPTATPVVTTEPPRVASRTRVGPRPNHLIEAGGRWWVGAWRSSRLDALDPETGRRLPGRVSVGGGTVDMVTWGDELWVATRANEIVRLDPVSGRRVAPPIPLDRLPATLARRGDDVVVGIQSGGQVAQLSRLDARTGETQATVEVEYGIMGAVYGNGELWTLHEAPNFIVRRDAKTLAALERIDLPGTSVGDLAYGAGAVWATIPDQDRLVRYRIRARLTASVEVGARPMGVAVRGSRVWVAANGSSTLEQVDAYSLIPAEEPLRVPLNPLFVAVGPDAVWVTCVGVNRVARVA